MEIVEESRCVLVGGRCSTTARRQGNSPVDKGSLIGSVIMTACVCLVFYMATHGHVEALWSLKGFIMVICASIGAVFMSMDFNRVLAVPGYMKKFLIYKGQPMTETIKQLYELGEKARRDGILALESEISKISDPFLASGLKAAVDGTSPENLEATMRLEILAMQDRHKSGKKFFDILKTYGPGLGLVATLIGQIGMFSALGGEISVMGHMLAVAVVATMYGTIIANCIAGPVGDKLAMRSAEEILNREMVLQGILSIQAGDNPRVTLDKVSAFVPAAARAKLKLAA